MKIIYRFIRIFREPLLELASVESKVLESKDFAQYQGMWVAILDKKVIASAKTMTKVCDMVSESKISRTPLFQKIPEQGAVDKFIF